MTNAHQSTTFSPSITMNSSSLHEKQQLANLASSKMVTPESEGSNSVSSQEDNSSADFLSPIHSMKNLSLYWSSSSATPATVITHVEVESSINNTSANKVSIVEACTREPSPIHERRTLFHEYSRDDDPSTELRSKPISSQAGSSVTSIRSREFSASTPYTIVPAIPTGERFHSSGSEVLSNGSHRLRSRKLQQNQLIDSGSISCSQSINNSDHRRRQSRRRSSNVTRGSYNTDVSGSSHVNLSFSLPVVHINDDVSISSDADSEGLRDDSPRKVDRKYRSRHRRKQLSSSLLSDLSNGGNNNNNNGNDTNTSWMGLIGKFSQRYVTTNALVWTLCFVGLISTSMVVTTSRKISHSLDENPHERVTILFQTPKHQSISSFRGRLLPSLNGPSSRFVKSGGTGEQMLHGGSINLHSLSRFQGDRDVLSSSTSNDKTSSHTKQTNKSKHHHTKQHKHSSHINDDTKSGVVASVDIFQPIELHLLHPNTILLENDRISISQHDLSYSSHTSINKRIVLIGGDMDFTLPNHRDMELYPSPFTDNTQLYPILDSSDEGEDERIRTMERRPPYENGECVPMSKWQTTYYPSCNGMHELNLADYDDTDQKLTLFGKNGFWRNAWRFDSAVSGPSLETVILKTLRINHRFEDKYYEHNRIDAVVLERLTSSQHVIDIFGFCGHSVLTEFADGKRLGDLADKNKKNPLVRLKIAVDIASGLADVHSIDGEDSASFVHLDINPANVVSVKGTLKLNDFNIGVPRKWNTTSNQACGIPAQYPNPQWRSPEEARGENTLTEKVDVFSLGHIFFRLICGHEPWHKLEPNGMPPKHELNEKVKSGVLPTIPVNVLKSKNPEVIAIRDAMLQCYQYNPSDRPSARKIADTLQSTLSKLEKKIYKKELFFQEIYKLKCLSRL